MLLSSFKTGVYLYTLVLRLLRLLLRKEVNSMSKRIKLFKKIIFSWHWWDEMGGKQRKAISFGFFSKYLTTIYYGKGRYYGIEF